MLEYLLTYDVLIKNAVDDAARIVVDLHVADDDEASRKPPDEEEITEYDRKT